MACHKCKIDLKICFRQAKSKAASWASLDGAGGCALSIRGEAQQKTEIAWAGCRSLRVCGVSGLYAHRKLRLTKKTQFDLETEIRWSTAKYRCRYQNFLVLVSLPFMVIS